jgi:tRNA A-37 threonylcarbamoyl transferase component Bud32
MANGQASLADGKRIAGGVCWEAVPEYQEMLFGPDGLRLDDWLRDGQARVVKHGPHRTVYRVTLPGLDCHLKHYRLHDVRAWMRELVRPSKARMEYERALAVAACGVATITPLALGEVCRGIGPADSFLLTHTLEDAIPLNYFVEVVFSGLPLPRQTFIRQQLATALGDFLARLHDAGIVHNDLHAGNILLRLDADDRPHLYLIDLHALRLTGRPLAWQATRANLVLFNRWFALRAGRADRLRFWSAYSGSRQSPPWEHGQGPTGLRELARELECLTWESNLRFWRSRDRRCLVSNRYYQRVRHGNVAGYRVTDLDGAALAPLLLDPDEPFRRPGVRLLKDSRSSTVAELDMPVQGVLRRVIYKRFRVTSWSDPWTALVRQPPALRSWVHGHGLRERCLPTPRPLAVLHRRRSGLFQEGYLLTEKIENGVDLRRFVAGLDALPLAHRRTILRHGIDRVARLVRELHHCSLAQRDLKAANILVSGDWSAPHFWLIDLVGVTRHRKLSRRRRVQNLARLHASFVRHPALSRTDKLRFLRVYLQWGLFGRETWKTWWRAIDQAPEDKIARNERSGRPLA